MAEFFADKYFTSSPPAPPGTPKNGGARGTGNTKHVREKGENPPKVKIHARRGMMEWGGGGGASAKINSAL